MRTKVIAIGIIAMIALCATVAMAAIDTQIYMTPDTLNLNSGGKYVTAFLNEEDLGGYSPDDLFLTDDTENGGINIPAVKVCDDPNEEYDYAVKFSRVEVIGWLNAQGIETGTVTLYVVHPDSETIVGYDTFIVKMSNKKQQ